MIAAAALVFASPALATTLIVRGQPRETRRRRRRSIITAAPDRAFKQIYASNFFAGAELINGFSFRAYPGASPSYFFGNSVDISDVVIRLSTTAAGADESGSLPSATFADNLESDATTVFSGALDLLDAATGTGPQPFDYTVSFSQPFLYNPADGDLLLDVMIPSGATVSGAGFGFLTFDTVNTIDDGVYSVVNISDGGATSGTLSTAGAITAFSVSAAVPEASTWLMLVAGFGVLGAAALEATVGGICLQTACGLRTPAPANAAVANALLAHQSETLERPAFVSVGCVFAVRSRQSLQAPACSGGLRAFPSGHFRLGSAPQRRLKRKRPRNHASLPHPHLRRLDPRRGWRRRPAFRLVPSHPRPRRLAVHRSARPLRPDPMRGRSGFARLRAKPKSCARNSSSASTARCASARPAPKTPKCRPASSRSTAREIEVLGPAGDLPLPVFGDQPYPEDTRLRYRFLDLRREKLHQNIMLRGQVIDSLRKRMKGQGFFEFQTPILTASSPEGARDFLVPSRMHPGKFYALPQAPQQYKQLLMMAGFDRYFQIAPCFRDEDPRADRLPGEFYQLDIEMSFVEQDDVFAAMEPVIRGAFEEFARGKPVTPSPWPRIPYAEAMRKYGSDKPDLRNPIVDAECLRAFPRLGLQGVRAAARGREKRSLGDSRARRRPADVCRPDERLGAGRGPAGARLHPVLRSRPGRDDAQAPTRRRRALAGRGPLANNIGPERVEAVRLALGLKAGDAAFFVAGDPEKFAQIRRARAHEGRPGAQARRRGSVRIRLDRRFPDVRVERRREEGRLLAQSLLDAAGRPRGARRARIR